MISFFIIALYLSVTVAVGIYGHHRGQKNPDDYFLASRAVGPLVMLFTLTATNFSAFFFLGFAGAGYRIGYSYYGIMSFGTALVALSFYFIGHKAWKLGKQHGYITPPELIGDRFRSRTLKVVFLAFMVIFTMPYLAIQPIGAGYLLSELTGGAVPYFWGAVLLTSFMVLYVFLGGMRSVALTDVIQGILIVALIVLAVSIIGGRLGGVFEANERVYEIKPELFSREVAGAFFTRRRWFSFMVLFFFAVPMFPQVFMRFFIPRSPSSLKLAATLYPIVTAFLFFGPILIGVMGHVTFPNLVGNDSDQILPMMLAQHAPAWLATLVMVGALAAFMSTMDSQLLALSSMLTRDIYLEFIDRGASIEKQVKLGKVLVVALSVVGLIIAYRPPDTIFDIATEAFTGLAVLFPTTIAALYLKKVPAWSCVLSILTGQLLLIGFHYEVIPAGWSFGFLPLIPILAVCFGIILAGSMLAGMTERVNDRTEGVGHPA